MTADVLRQAVATLRCEHSFPVQPPLGSFARPGACSHCGIAWNDHEPVADKLREPLAVLLESVADEMESHGAVEGTASKAVHAVSFLGLGGPRADWTAALATARAILGDPKDEASDVSREVASDASPTPSPVSRIREEAIGPAAPGEGT